MSTSQNWYIIQFKNNNQCQVLSSLQLEDKPASEISEIRERWGPFDSPQEAITKRVGLIRSGKCHPA